MSQPPTSRLLLLSLQDFVKRAVKNYPFPDPSGGWLDCRVFLHDLPEEQEAATYPFVIIRWLSGETENGDSFTNLTDTTGLFCGVYAPRTPAEAGLLLAELLDSLRQKLWTTRILAGKFEQIQPLKIQAADAERQIHRYHLATIETAWQYVWPSREQIELTNLARQ